MLVSLARQLQHGFHFLARGGVVVAVQAQREAADLLDALEEPGALLLAHGVAEQAAEQADVVAQGLVLVGGRDGHGRYLSMVQDAGEEASWPARWPGRRKSLCRARLRRSRPGP
jgi:hypothetical protein